ncbi:DUF5615 family PIN-like protein [Treponema endosymbiont of Eucomonympha sp.]|uniref:DUF5615 family PIN-like protein n=1 Tax=Treponema endosymbiont of Eucomonympha sp. TaxID=1580831 RepID=UPI000783E244|nr:DUF5615 family PIN-like protein [Treponema endosymbiont of Eucomonympha sp.]
MAKRYRQSDITALVGKPVFFDANVLIYIFWPILSGQHWMQQYSKILHTLLTQGNCLVINTTGLSETINRVLRIEYENYQRSTGIPLKFKVYRDSPDGQSVLTDIYSIIINTIFPHFEICDKSFHKNEVHDMLHVDSLDFNDKLIMSICKKNQFVLLTNDADFQYADIDILTANSKLLANR